jgi:SpoIID/LytB domain protein
LELYTPPIDSGRRRLCLRRAPIVRRGALAVVAVIAATLFGLVFAAPASAATGDFIIQGRGYGHGVGMSQWGAWQAARDGVTYNAFPGGILDTYYPGSTLTTAPLGATIKVRISKDPASTSYDDHFYRVYLKPAVTTATLSMKNGGVTVATEAIAVGQIVEALYSGGRVWVVGRGVYDSMEVEPSVGTGRVAVSMQVSSVSAATTYREYWGYMSVEPMGGGELYLHNYVLLDKYARGVAEIKPEWANPAFSTMYAIEAVKAQAVAARTYAYAEFIASGYVNDDTRDICFKGYGYEASNPGAAQAAIDTNGEILNYGGVLYKTYFSAHSGGYTTATAWSDSPPSYVESNPDPWSLVAPPPGLVAGISPGYTWSVTVTPAELKTKLIDAGYIDDVGTIAQLDVTARDAADPNSHAKAVRVTGALGIDTISARDLRAALGLRSTLFSILKEGSLTRGENTSPLITYLGYWTTSTVAGASGGSVTSAASAAKVSVAFDGTYLSLLTKTAPYYGKATVTLDGGTPVTVDMYSPTVLYQQPVYNTGNLAAGIHTLTIEWTGTKNAASAGYMVGVDAFDVVGVLTQAEGPTRTEQSDTDFSYGGPWSTFATSSASGGNLSYVSAPGLVTVTFTGTYLAWIAQTSPYHGKAQVTLDAGAPVMIDLYSAGSLYKQSVYNTGLLIDGPHSVVIEWTGTKNGAASGYVVDVDAFDILGNPTPAPPAPPVPTRYEQTDWRLTFLGYWSAGSSASASAGSYLYSNSTGSAATVCFNGTSLSWLATTGPGYGVATVTLDGGAPSSVDFYTATTLYGQEVYNPGPLAPGDHTLTIECSGTKNVSSTGYLIDVDALDVIGTLTQAPAPTRFQQTESALSYVGPWSTSTTWSASGGSLYYLNSAGSVTVSFDGTYLAWVTKKSSVYGRAWVVLDGGSAFLVDLYSASTKYKQMVWNTGILPSGTHTVTIAWSGIKSSAASSYNIGVDTFDVIGTLNGAPPPYPTPSRYQNNNAKLAYLGAWSTTPTSYASGGSFKYMSSASTSPGSVAIDFDGTYLAWIATTGPKFGIATLTLDGGAPISVDLYSSSTLYQRNVWDTGLLPPGPHTLLIERSGTKNASSTGFAIDIDALDITGTLNTAPGPTRYEQTDSHFHYTGSWANSWTGYASAGYFKYTSSAATVTVNFNGTYLAWLAKKSYQYGQATVTLDGGPPVTVDLYSGTPLYQEIAYNTGVIAGGPHTLVIQWAGTKNASSSGYLVDVDAFEVLGSLL